MARRTSDPESLLDLVDAPCIEGGREAARALGRVGTEVIEPLIGLYVGSADSGRHALILYALGIVAESVKPGELPAALLQPFLDRLHDSLRDASPFVRAEGVRTLGTLARLGHLPPAERAWLHGACDALLGLDDARDWDRAYIVRVEAEEARRYC